MRQVLVLLTIFISLQVYSQATTLTVNVEACAGHAEGSVSVYYNSAMIAQKGLSEGAATMELNKAVGLNGTYEPHVSVYPVPSADGRITFKLENLNRESTRIEFHNLLGQQLGTLYREDRLSLPDVKGIVLYTIRDDMGSIRSGRLMINGQGMHINVEYSYTTSGGKNNLKSGHDNYIVLYRDMDYKTLRQDTVTIPEGSHKDHSCVVCAEKVYVYENPGGPDYSSDVRGEGSSTLGTTAYWTYYGGGSQAERHMFIYFDAASLETLGNKLDLTIKYRAGNKSPGLNTNNNTPNALRVGLFNNKGTEVFAGTDASNQLFSDYTGYFGGFAVKASNKPELFERQTGQSYLILGDIGQSLGQGTQSGDMASNQERIVTFSLERMVHGIQISMSQTGSTATFNFNASDTAGIEQAFNTIAIGLDDMPELTDWYWFDYINLEYTNYTPIIYYNLEVTGGSGSGSYRGGSSPEIRADKPAEGKIFDRWSGDISALEDPLDSVTTVTMNSNLSVMALFRDIIYSNLTVNSGSGSGILAGGTVQLIVADPPPAGKVFDRWTGDSTWVSGLNAATTTITMPDEAVTISATYRDGDYIIPVPVEVMGLPPHVEGVNFDLGPNGSTNADKLFVQVHNVAYYKKGRLRVNAGEWLDMTNDNTAIDMLEPDKSYGGFGGGFATVRFSIDKSDLNFQNGINTVEFEYNHRNKKFATAGYRVIRVKVLDSNGDNLIPASNYVEQDPTSWEPPINTPEAIAAGKAIWTSAELGIKAHCMDCHTRDGRDLKYFNVSNKTIIQQCVKSGFSQEAGMQVASYIRSVDIDVVPQARVWNPPYQPGPGTDNKPVYEWAAGAGIDAVLDTDEEMLPYIFGDGSKEAIDRVTPTDSNLNLREIPVAVQFPDWLSWIPEQNPVDIFDDWESSDAYKAYQTLFNQFQNQDLANSPNLINTFDQFPLDVMWWVGGYPERQLHPWCELSSPVLKAAKAKGYTAEWAKFNLSKWNAMKMWEMLNMFDAEDKAQAINPSAEPYQWPSREFGTFQIAAHFIGDDRGTSAFKWETLPVGTYFSSIWYELQMVLSSGMRNGKTVHPVDWAYNHFHVNRLGLRTGIYEPLRLLRNIIKCWQMRDIPGNSTISTKTWTMREVSPWRLYSNHSGDTTLYSYLNRYQPGLRTRVTNSMLESWLRKSNEYPVSAWPRTNVIDFGSPLWEVLEYANYDPTGKQNPGTKDLFAPGGGSDAIEAHAFWRMIPRFKADGIDPHIISELAKWSDKIWTNPNTNWEQWFE
ncbi:hypothetical protein ACFLR8_02325 [Bacteroidota bacterium]